MNLCLEDLGEVRAVACAGHSLSPIGFSAASFALIWGAGACFSDFSQREWICELLSQYLHMLVLSKHLLLLKLQILITLCTPT